MLKIKKAGRPTKEQIRKLNQANSIIQKMSPEQQKSWNRELKSEQELDQIIEELSVAQEPAPVVQEPIKQTNKMAQDLDFDFSPLDAPVKERSYNQQVTATDATEIPEPNFDGPVSGAAQPNPQASTQSAPQSSPNPQPSYEQSSHNYDEPLRNEALNDVDDKTKKQAAAQLADTILDAYKMAHGFAANFAKVDESKLMEKISKGELDPELQIPIDEHTVVTPLEYFQTMNAQVEENIAYDEDFGKRVKPAMTRVFEKKGWGLTDEQYLMVEFGKDIAVKTALIVGLKKNTNMMLNMFMTMTQQKNQGMMNDGPVTSVSPDHITHDKPASETTPPPAPATPEDVEAQFIDAEEVETE